MGVPPFCCYQSSTGVSTSSGLMLLLAFPAVYLLCCCRSLTAVDVPGILAVAINSAVAAVPAAVGVPFAASIFNVSGVTITTVTNVPEPASLLFLTFHRF